MISTRKYKTFVAPIVADIERYFLPGHQKTIFLFTDERQKFRTEIPIEQIIVPDYKWPFATLYRYKMFNDNAQALSKCSHLFYMDVDMSIVSKIDTDILSGGLVATRHPGFYMSDGWGDSNNPENSTSFMPSTRRKHYYAGGFQGGTAEHYLEMAKTLAANIDEDTKIGVTAEHNDETHFNQYINWKKPDGVQVLELTPEYVMVEQPHLRQQWGLSKLNPKILALSKNHAEIRS